MFGSANEAYLKKGSLELCGQVSKSLAKELLGGESKSLIDTYEKLTGLFVYLDYQSELWDLVRVILEGKMENPKNRIAYYQSLHSFYLVNEFSFSSGLI